LGVLVVDDYTSVINITRQFLKGVGIVDVDSATDGAAAWEMIQDKKYDLVLSDWNMKPVSGFELLKRCRDDPRFVKLPLILITAEAKMENIMAAKAAGANGYIVKPFNQAVLKQKIAAVLPSYVR